MKSRLQSFLLFCAALLFQGCSATHSIRTEEVSPAWGGNAYARVLVIGVYDDRAYRASAETALAEELKGHGIAAEPSHGAIPDLGSLDSEEEIAELLAGRDNDVVLSVATIDPGYDYDYEDALATRGMVRLLGGRPGAFTSLGSFITWAGSGSYTLHIGLWDATTQKPVWQATTDSQTTGSESEDVKALARFVVDTLRKKGML